MNNAASILSTLTLPVLVLNNSLQAEMANPAFYDALMIERGELRGKTIEELIVGSNALPDLIELLEKLQAGESHLQSTEIRCVVPSGELRIFSTRASRVTAGDYANALVLVELRDITYERKVEHEIRDLNQALNERSRKLEDINEELESFTHSASHDLRTPLRFTNKIACLLLQEEGERLTESATNRIQMILDSTEEMGSLIENLLAFAQIKHSPIKKRLVDLRRLSREALVDLQEERVDRDVQVEIGNLPPCQADRDLLKQVILNLMANALKFTRRCEHAVITVDFMQADEGTIYYVRDNGIGFDMSHANAVFQPFHRLHRAQSFEGSGIGLALVKRIVDYHNGRVWAVSQAGEGATFFFTLGQPTTPDTGRNINS